MSSEQQPEEILRKLVSASQKKGREIAKRSGKLYEWGHEIADFSDASSGVVRFPLPPNTDYERLISSWQIINDQQDIVLAALGSVSIGAVTTSGSAAAYSMVELAQPDNVIRYVPNSMREEARGASERLGQVIAKLADKQRVLPLMRQFGLDRAALNQRSPLELILKTGRLLYREVQQTWI